MERSQHLPRAFRERAQEVKRGVWQAGGLPVELPVMSLSEMFMKPTSMFYRNLVAMEVEETLRCHPLDGAVLMGGCDKTTPALLMGAITMDLPCIYLPAGAMAKGCWRGQHAGQRQRCLEILGRTPRRSSRLRSMGRTRRRHRAQPRHLHDDGHRRHDDERGRSAGAEPARRVRRFPPMHSTHARMATADADGASWTWCGRT